MVKKPDFKVIVKDEDITDRLKSNLISISYSDSTDNESDEMSFKVSGIFKRPDFGDEIELYLGIDGELFLCGKFSVSVVRCDYKGNTTEVKASAMNSSRGDGGKDGSKGGSKNSQKSRKTRSWENTTLFAIGTKIASENGLATKFSGANINIHSVLQQNRNDMDFILDLCLEYGYFNHLKNSTLIISDKVEYEI